MNRRNHCGIFLLAFVVTLANFPLPVAAHPLAPSSLRLRAQGDGRVEVRWRRPTIRPRGAELILHLPMRCRTLSAPRSEVTSDRSAVESRWTVNCGEGGLVGGVVRVDGLDRSSTNVVIEVIDAEGEGVRGLLHRGAPSFEVPRARGGTSIFADYLRLGVEHLVTGPDHVLFVLGLLLLIRRWRRLVTAITAFTLGHSLSLALAALGVVSLPAAPIEVAIAATLLVLALDILRERRGESPGPVARWPWAVCAAFGLLHGMGFAGALAHTGLPEGAIPLSLFAFNVGIEIGQVGIVVIALGLWRIGRKIIPKRLVEIKALPAYFIGAMAASWVLERGLGGLGLLPPL